MSVAPSNPRIDSALFEDMSRALSSEFGARAFYGAFARSLGERELGRLLAGFHDEEIEQIERLRALIQALGGRAPAHRRRRAIAAWALALACRFGARQIGLRLCHESETTVARWYLEFAAYLARAGELAHARTCESLASTKQRHAFALEAWVPR